MISVCLLRSRMVYHDNRDNAYKVFSRVFLARLEVFDLFTEIMVEIQLLDHGERQTETDSDAFAPFKLRWLLLQLQPSLVHESESFKSCAERLQS